MDSALASVKAWQKPLLISQRRFQQLMMSSSMTSNNSISRASPIIPSASFSLWTMMPDTRLWVAL